MNNKNHKTPIQIYDGSDDVDTSMLQEQLMSFPRPTLNDDARARILQRVHAAIPEAQPEVVQATSRMIRFRYPAQSALRLAASIAIFVVMLYQFGLPAIQDTHSVETIYPIQRSAEMQGVELIAEYFS